MSGGGSSLTDRFICAINRSSSRWRRRETYQNQSEINTRTLSTIVGTYCNTYPSFFLLLPMCVCVLVFLSIYISFNFYSLSFPFFFSVSISVLFVGLSYLFIYLLMPASRVINIQGEIEDNWNGCSLAGNNGWILPYYFQLTLDKSQDSVENSTSILFCSVVSMRWHFNHWN